MGKFIVTHQAREKLVKEGGTTLIFVAGGIESALQQAQTAAGDKRSLWRVAQISSSSS